MPEHEDEQAIATPATEASSLPFPLDVNTLHSLKSGGFILSGIVTLTAGVATVGDRRIKTGSVPFVSYSAPAGTTGTNLKAVCTQGTLTVTAVDTAGSTVTTDTSVVSYLIIL